MAGHTSLYLLSTLHYEIIFMDLRNGHVALAHNGHVDLWNGHVDVAQWLRGGDPRRLVNCAL